MCYTQYFIQPWTREVRESCLVFFKVVGFSSGVYKFLVNSFACEIIFSTSNYSSAIQKNATRCFSSNKLKSVTSTFHELYVKTWPNIELFVSIKNSYIKFLEITCHPFEPSPPNNSHQQQGWFYFSNENEVKIMHDDELWVFFPAIFSLVVCQVMHSWCCHAATPSMRVNEQKIKLSNLIFYCLRMIWTFQPNNFK